MKKFLLIVCLALIGMSSFAQVVKPVKWLVSLQKSDEKATYPDQVVFSATIDEGWHLYGTNIPENGPLPTVFKFEKSEGVVLIGKPEPDKSSITKFDKSFNMELSFFETNVTFIQKIKVEDAAKFALDGYVEFMACDDERCIPPDDHTFELRLEQPAAMTETTKAPAKEKSETPWGFFWLAFLED